MYRRIYQKLKKIEKWQFFLKKMKISQTFIDIFVKSKFWKMCSENFLKWWIFLKGPDIFSRKFKSWKMWSSTKNKKINGK